MLALLLLLLLGSAVSSGPLWAPAWNATTIKIRPGSGAPPHWGRIYYDYNLLAQRQDFFPRYFSYPADDGGWGTPSCSILFAKGNIYFLWPDGSCDTDHVGIPPVSPKWLLGSVYQGRSQIRGVPTDQWYLPSPSNVTYWNRVDAPLVPVRSSNQVNDPGATDYVDVLFGEQNAELFAVPEACIGSGPPTQSCPPWDAK